MSAIVPGVFSNVSTMSSSSSSPPVKNGNADSPIPPAIKAFLPQKLPPKGFKDPKKLPNLFGVNCLFTASVIGSL